MNQSRLPPRDQLIMGIHALHEVLLHAPERLLCVYTDAMRCTGRKAELLSLCEKRGVKIVLFAAEKLDQMTGSDSHQSVVAHVKGRAFLNVPQFLERLGEQDRSLVLMIDQIFDPQNFGSLIRSAECLGADAIVWSKNRGADLTPSVAKASCGASELLPLIRISNLAEAVGQFQKGGYEAVATLLEPNAQNAFSYQFSPRTLLIVGSEGEGIQPLIRKKADSSLYIPMAGKIDSLNVSQAACVLMSLFYRDRFVGKI
ncbi:MAG: 23S rRNA (guanosine(2251)-2'-O)-methyltransferase RlmB [Chlamydiia bacterium]|nr:23S rRNA (guanosine(2251)-2'-O)-methyltransferase RlmB [Chlamydiia bacterium]